MPMRYQHEMNGVTSEYWTTESGFNMSKGRSQTEKQEITEWWKGVEEEGKRPWLGWGEEGKPETSVAGYEVSLNQNCCNGDSKKLTERPRHSRKGRL